MRTVSIEALCRSANLQDPEYKVCRHFALQLASALRDLGTPVQENASFGVSYLGNRLRELLFPTTLRLVVGFSHVRRMPELHGSVVVVPRVANAGIDRVARKLAPIMGGVINKGLLPGSQGWGVRTVDEHCVALPSGGNMIGLLLDYSSHRSQPTPLETITDKTDHLAETLAQGIVIALNQYL